MRQLVAPFAGAWIEILNCRLRKYIEQVAPFAGAWIEISPCYTHTIPFIVAPFAGAWIEISVTVSFAPLEFSRSLRGSVD